MHDPSTHRAYFFGNLYLSSIQQGIQAAHVVTQMFSRYQEASEEHELLHAWGRHGVTKVLLEGGPQANLEIIFQIMQHCASFLRLPCGAFFESQAALNGALTSVGVVVPESVYALKVDVDDFMGFCHRAQIFSEEDRKTAFAHPANMHQLLPLVDDESSAKVILFYLLRWGKLAS